MNKPISLSIATLALLTLSCTTPNNEQNPIMLMNAENGIPPFDKIKEEHYIPAFEQGMSEQIKEIEQIIGQIEEPTFENTILAFDKSGLLLNSVNSLFSNLYIAINNKKMQEIARQINPKLSQHKDNILLNSKLFSRIKYLFDNRDKNNYSDEQLRAIEKYYNDFVRSGAGLDSQKQTELRNLNSKVTLLNLQFNEHILAETNENFRLVIDNKDDLAGLPQFVIAGAAQTAQDLGMDGKWVFTLQKPSWLPFLQYSEKRDLREKIYKGWFMRGNNGDKFDTKKIIEELTQIQTKRANLLGYNTYAQFVISNNMAETPEKVNNFLMNIWEPALKKAKQELDELQAIADAQQAGYKIESWDWWYFAEQLRKQKYGLDENELKPYFVLENVRNGMFWVANRLFGITFRKVDEAPKYHIDNEVYEAIEADGTHIGILYLDYHPRSGKDGGAWCTTYRQSYYNAENQKVHPIVSIVCNFTQPTTDMPSLLTWDETETLFHEFGHALHSLFSNGKYKRTSGDVPLDYVEFPSQIMENWAGEPQVLKQYAKHYLTGEILPDSLVEKINKSRLFNQGFATVEYVAAALLDQQWYSQTVDKPVNNTEEFEKNEMEKIGLIPQILPRYRSTYYSHIFGGDYSAGYYVYLWAEVLESDAFDAFKQTGNIFNTELAAKYRQHCLEEVGTYPAMEQYKKFRGQEPSETPLLIKRALISK